MILWTSTYAVTLTLRSYGNIIYHHDGLHGLGKGHHGLGEGQLDHGGGLSGGGEAVSEHKRAFGGKQNLTFPQNVP